jgi:hypothetical protein
VTLQLFVKVGILKVVFPQPRISLILISNRENSSQEKEKKIIVLNLGLRNFLIRNYLKRYKESKS